MFQKYSEVVLREKDRLLKFLFKNFLVFKSKQNIKGAKPLHEFKIMKNCLR